MAATEYEIIGNEISHLILDYQKNGFLQIHRENSDILIENMIQILSPEDKVWESGLLAIADTIVINLPRDSSTWHSAISVLSAQFLNAHVKDKHPIIDTRMHIGSAENKRYIIHIDLAGYFIMSLMSKASIDERKEYINSIDNWYMLQGLTKTLSDIVLEPDELLLLLNKIDILTSNDMGRGGIFQDVADWISYSVANRKVAREAIEKYLSKDSPSDGYHILQFLIESLVKVDKRYLPLRDKLLKHLLSQKTLIAWETVVKISCFAWPKSTEPQVRHQSLLENVQLLPDQLVNAGLFSVACDARDYPLESAQTALNLLDTYKPALDDKILGHVCHLLRNAAWTLESLEDTKQLSVLSSMQKLLSILYMVPPNLTNQYLDSILHSIAKVNYDVVFEFLSNWLSANVHFLQQEVIYFDYLFPCLSSEVDQKMYTEWLYKYLVADNAALRLASAAILGRRMQDNLLFPQSLFTTFSFEEALGAAYQIVGTGSLGHIWIPTLFSMGKCRADILSKITELLMNEAAPNYPGTTEMALSIWTFEYDDADSHHQSIRNAKAEITKILDGYKEGHRLKEQCPEIFATSPSRFYWTRFEQRRFSKQFEKHRSERKSISSLFPRVPISRGEGTILNLESDKITPFQNFSSSYELPIGEIIDPISSILRRRMYLFKANELLTNNSTDNGDDN